MLPVTIRSLILGLLAAACIAGVGYINDSVLWLTPLVGNHLPIIVFGSLIVCVGVLNPLLRVGRRLRRLAPGELAVIVALALAACSVPGSGLMRTFVNALALPAHYNRQLPGWQRREVLDYVPDALLAADGEYSADVHTPLLVGAGEPGDPIGMDEVPWSAWGGPLSVWIPLVALIGLCCICLAVIVHTQWSRRERLRYPIVAFASSLLEQDGRAVPPILRSRAFWMGLAVVLTIRVINGLGTEAWGVIELQIPLQMNLWPVAEKYPSIGAIPAIDWLLKPMVWPAVVGFSFFLATDVAFSLGISHILYVIVTALVLRSGVDLGTAYLTGGGQAWQYFGSYVGVALIIAYTGRRYYRSVLLGAAGFRTSDADRSAVWAMRLLVPAAAATVAIFVGIGLDWMFAVILVLAILLMYTVMTRINAESGLFFCQPGWQPLALFIGLFGAAAMGAQAYIIIALACAVITIDPRESLMPFVANGLKLSERTQVRPARTARWSALALLIALAVATPVVLWAAYNFGLQENDGWAMRYVPKMPFDALVGALSDIPEGTPDRLSAWDHLTRMSPDLSFFAWAGAGLVGVLVLSTLRLRWVWWPIHPIFLLVWGTFPLGMFHASFLIGWLIRTLITRFGGRNAYRRALPFMIGVIAGDLLAGLIFMAAGAVYYLATGLIPPTYRVFPG